MSSNQLMQKAIMNESIFEDGRCLFCKHPEEDHFYGGCNYQDPYLKCQGNTLAQCICKGQRQLLVRKLPTGYVD